VDLGLFCIYGCGFRFGFVLHPSSLDSIGFVLEFGFVFGGMLIFGLKMRGIGFVL